MNAPNLLRPPAPSPEPLLVSTRDAARMLGVSVRTVETLRARGDLPAVRLPRGGLRHDVADLRRLIEESKVRR